MHYFEVGDEKVIVLDRGSCGSVRRWCLCRGGWGAAVGALSVLPSVVSRSGWCVECLFYFVLMSFLFPVV